jgi:hypothetical protein
MLPMLRISAKARITARITDGTGPSRQRRSNDANGDKMKLSRIAKANGMKISRPTYRATTTAPIAAIIINPDCGRVIGTAVGPPDAELARGGAAASMAGAVASII